MKDLKKLRPPPDSPPLVSIPLPDGGFATFRAVPNPRVKKYSEWLRKTGKIPPAASGDENTGSDGSAKP